MKKTQKIEKGVKHFILQKLYVRTRKYTCRMRNGLTGFFAIPQTPELPLSTRQLYKKFEYEKRKI